MMSFVPYPAIIKSYDPNRRKVRVEIPPLTDGDEIFPEADIIYPIGDKSKHTEIRILEGDTVWVSFAGGDMRYPVVIGWRNPEQGNDVGWRRWHHANMEMHADGTMLLRGDALIIEFNTITTTGVTTHNSAITNKNTVLTEGMVTNMSTTSCVGGINNGSGGQVVSTGGFRIQGGNVDVQGGDVTADGISVKNHVHGGVLAGGGNTSKPK